jgi:hypothetical protein
VRDDPRALVPAYMAAEIIGVHDRTLRRWRKRGIGPPHLPRDAFEWKMILYRVADLIAWQIGESDPAAVIARWYRTPAARDAPARAPCLARRPLRRVQPWRAKGQRKTRGCPVITRFRCELARIESEMILAGLQDRLDRLASR